MNASPQCSVKPEQLRGWLDGSLDAEAARSLESHVESCPSCQSALDSLTACNLPTDLLPSRRRMHSEPHDAGTRLNSEEASSAALEEIPGIVSSLAGFDQFRPLGRGGMGTVYLARQIALNRLVALKFLSEEHRHTNVSVARLRTEARIIASLKHPQIVSIHDVVEHRGYPVLILEYIEGGNLADLCDRERVHPLLACRLVALVAQGVQAAHERGVLHRDLKPSNILMDGYNPKITDFGLARSVDNTERLTSSGKLFGTPHYMAPEVIREGSEASSAASDVFALGVILYELLTGSPPFSGSSTYQILDRIVRDEPPALQDIVPDLNPRIAAVCLAALSKDPAQRPESALQFSQLLHNIISAEERLANAPWDVIARTESPLRSGGSSTGHEQSRRTHNPSSTTTAIGAGSSKLSAIASRSRRMGWIIAASVLGAIAIIMAAINGTRNQPDDDVRAPLEPQSLAGTEWVGSFDFHPADGESDGDAELVIESHSGKEFTGIYYSENRTYAWRIAGRLEGEHISWTYTEAILDNETASVVGFTEVEGTLTGGRITAQWHQTGPTPSDADMQLMRKRISEDQ